MIQAIVFYLFAGIMVASGAMVISARNPVHSVLFLILAFFNAAGLFVLMGAEFLAMILVVVYVGAVAVLFLFVVMMLDIDFSAMREGFLKYAPIGAAIGLVLLAELVLVGGAWIFSPEAPQALGQPTPDLSRITNTHALGRILYTDYIFVFQAAGLILLVAMIGAIVLTLQHKRDVRRQKVSSQVGRTREAGVELVEVDSGRGLS